jgi:hypothetical protein
VSQATFAIIENGVPVVIDPATVVTLQFLSVDGATVLTAPRPILSTDVGANWASGIVGVTLLPTEVQALAPPAVMACVAGAQFVKRFRVNVESTQNVVKSQLFIKDYVLTEMRAERLLLLAATFFPGAALTDEYIWNKVVAAETETGFDLRVPLVPTQFFSIQPTALELAQVPPGMPWAIDPAQDYTPDFFQGEKWGFMVLRNKPLIDVTRVQFIYPSPTFGFYDFPLDWLRIDKKYAQVRFVPASSGFVSPLNAFLLQALGGGRTIPFAFNVTYKAGIDARRDFPQLIDVIKRRATLKIIEDFFLPSSGSISADGLSQSLSIAMDGYREMIEATLYGPKGSNGGIETAIHGVRMYSLGN